MADEPRCCQQCGSRIDPEGSSLPQQRFTAVYRNGRPNGPETLTYQFCSPDCVSEFHPGGR